jgi:hypothetical protein
MTQLLYDLADQLALMSDCEPARARRLLQAGLEGGTLMPLDELGLRLPRAVWDRMLWWVDHSTPDMRLGWLYGYLMLGDEEE